MSVPIQVGTSMASPYKSLQIWLKHFVVYLVNRIFFWTEPWRGSLYIYLLSFPRFRTLSIERFWFSFWSILNGVTLKTRNTPRQFLLHSNIWLDKLEQSWATVHKEYCQNGGQKKPAGKYRSREKNSAGNLGRIHGSCMLIMKSPSYEGYTTGRLLPTITKHVFQ